METTLSQECSSEEKLKDSFNNSEVYCEATESDSETSSTESDNEITYVNETNRSIYGRHYKQIIAIETSLDNLKGEFKWANTKMEGNPRPTLKPEIEDQIQLTCKTYAKAYFNFMQILKKETSLQPETFLNELKNKVLTVAHLSRSDIDGIDRQTFLSHVLETMERLINMMENFKL